MISPAQNGTLVLIDFLVGWQANPSRRGTLEIVWNCALTIFACTWSIQHLNLPAPEDGALKRFLRKVGWAVWTILFPEFLLALGGAELCTALQSMKSLKGCGKFRIRAPDLKYYVRWLLPNKPKRDAESGEESDPEHEQEPEWTLEHSYYAMMGGYLLCIESQDLPVEKRTEILPMFGLSGDLKEDYIALCVLTPSQFEDYFDRQKPSLRPGDWLSQEEIKDRGKSSFFTKFFALTQLLYLGLSILVRYSQHKAVSQLELVTLGFGICGFFSYVVRWFKPQGIETHIRVWLRNIDVDDEEHMKKLHQAAFNISSTAPATFYNALRRLEDGKIEKKLRMPNDAIGGEPRKVPKVFWTLALLAMLVGAFHLFAWRFAFPTAVERTLWIVSCFVLIGSPLISLLGVSHFRQYAFEKARDNFVLRVQRALQQHGTDVEDNGFFKRAFNELAETKWPTTNWTTVFDGVRPESAILDEFEARQRENLEGFSLLRKVMGGILAKQFVEPADIVSFWTPNDFRFWSEIILVLTGSLYCIARLATIAVAISSLRAMPDSVYDGTWVDVLPTLS